MARFSLLCRRILRVRLASLHRRGTDTAEALSRRVGTGRVGRSAMIVGGHSHKRVIEGLS